MQPTVLVAAVLLLAASVRAQSICETYVVEEGDTIGSIASQFSVSEADLVAAMTEFIKGYTPGTFLFPNQTIPLPPFYAACAYVKVAGGKGMGWDQCKYYVVQPNDILSNIATSLGLNPIDLEALNPKGSTLQVNDNVKLPGWYDGCPLPGDQTPCRYYRVKSTESLFQIAIAFSVDIAELQAVNPDLSSDTAALLQPGQRVNIPPFYEACVPAEKEVEKPKSGMCNAYVVVDGDSFASIAAAFKTTTQQVLDVNPALAATTTLSVGTEVFIPPYNEADCAAGVNYVTPNAPEVSPVWWVPETVIPSPAPSVDATIQEEGAPAPAGEEAPELVADAPTPAPAPAPAVVNRRMRI